MSTWILAGMQEDVCSLSSVRCSEKLSVRLGAQRPTATFLEQVLKKVLGRLGLDKGERDEKNRGEQGLCSQIDVGLSSPTSPLPAFFPFPWPLALPHISFLNMLALLGLIYMTYNMLWKLFFGCPCLSVRTERWSVPRRLSRGTPLPQRLALKKN